MPRTKPSQIFEKKAKNERVVVLTAYDYPHARILDEQGVDVILVGDSLGMVVLGHENTLSVTMEDMIHHTKAVARAVKQALVVADMPYRSYETPELALKNAKRLMDEGGADAVKLEGGANIKAQVEALRQAGIDVMGHIGMTPQSVQETGGYKVQGRDQAQAETIVGDATCLEALGVFALVMECVPAALGTSITEKIKCPTVGIGAGPKTNGQVLVLHDLLGYQGSVKPRFARAYAELDRIIRDAVSTYRQDVLDNHFPSEKESY